MARGNEHNGPAGTKAASRLDVSVERAGRLAAARRSND